MADPCSVLLSLLKSSSSLFDAVVDVVFVAAVVAVFLRMKSYRLRCCFVVNGISLLLAVRVYYDFITNRPGPRLWIINTQIIRAIRAIAG